MNKSWLALLMALALNCAALPVDPPSSIYHLEVRLTNQRGEVHGLDVYRGQPVLISMFYGGCAATCPLIIETLRATERALGAAQRARLRVLLISIDPQNDTPARLRELAETRRLDTRRWTLAQADAAGVRQIAAVLNVKYRRLPDGDYNHSTVIAALTSRGEIAATSSVLGRTDEALVAALRR